MLADQDIKFSAPEILVCDGLFSWWQWEVCRDHDLYVAMFLLFIESHLVTFKGKIHSLFDQHQFWYFSFLPFTVSHALLVFYFAFCANPLCSAASLSYPEAILPLKALFAMTEFQLVGLIPVRAPCSSLRTAWPCPRGRDFKAPPADPTSRYWMLCGCSQCHPPGRMGALSLLSEVCSTSEAVFKVFTSSWVCIWWFKKVCSFKRCEGKRSGRWSPGWQTRCEREDVGAKDRLGSCHALGCTDLSCTYSKYLWVN